jgi:hypothetical protein
MALIKEHCRMLEKFSLVHCKNIYIQIHIGNKNGRAESYTDHSFLGMYNLQHNHVFRVR